MYHKGEIMYTSTTDPSRKFGSAFRGKKFDSYHAGPQPGEENENSHATSQEHTGDKVNTSAPEAHKDDPSSERVSTPEPSAIVQEHGPSNSTHYTHDHKNNKHTVSSSHDGGFTHTTEHSDADTAYQYGSKLSLEEGGEDSWKDTKKRLHPDQQSADSEERNYEAIGSAGM
jgi:hypothetical protein